MIKNLQQHELCVRNYKTFPIHYTRHFIDGQIKVCKGKLNFLASSLLREGIREKIVQLEHRLYQHLKTHQTIPFGFDYLIEVEHVG